VIVVDASALIEVLTRSERGQRVESRIMRASESIHVPALIDLEVAQVLRRYASSRQVPAHWARMALDIATAFPMTRYLHEPLMKRVWELRENLTAYDAAYVALAEALRAPLVTCDARLARARGAQAAVELIS
jgi:predicted nucleic acid-binding protein